MRIDVKEKIPKLIEITNEHPFKFGTKTLANKVELSPSTVWKYAIELNLPIKRKRVFTEEEKDFVRRNHKKYRQFEAAKILGIHKNDAGSIARKLGVRFKEAPVKKKVVSRFFEHDEYYMIGGKR